MQRLPPLARLMIQAKSWPICLVVRETTLDRVWLSPTPVDWLDQTFDSFLRLLSDALPLFTLFLVMVFLYDQLYLATVMTLKTNPCHEFGLPNHLPSDKCFWSQKLLNELIIKVFDGISIFPSIPIYPILHIAKTSSKTEEWFLTLPFSCLPCIHTLVRQFGHWMQLCPEKDSLCGCFFGNDQDQRGGRLYGSILKIQDSSFTILGIKLLTFP